MFLSIFQSAMRREAGLYGEDTAVGAEPRYDLYGFKEVLSSPAPSSLKKIIKNYVFQLYWYQEYYYILKSLFDIDFIIFFWFKKLGQLNGTLKVLWALGTGPTVPNVDFGGSRLFTARGNLYG